MRRDWKFIAAVAVLTLIAVVRVAATHRVFSITVDEPAHLGDGDHWFAGRYAVDVSHPPLARVLCALPLRLHGVPPDTQRSEIERGHALLSHGHYDTNLARARRGNLVLLAIAIAATAAWSRRVFSRGTAILAVAIFTSAPPVLAHAGLITTDMAVTATLPLALLALEALLDRPSVTRWLVLGAAIGLGLLAKLSFLVYFPAAALVVLIARRPPRVRWPHALLLPLAAFVVLWGGYRFSFGKASDLSRDAVFLFHYAAPEPLIPLARRLAETPLPAPAYVLGVATLAFRDKHLGHPSYFLGQSSTAGGWWYYFPVILFYKTPIPLLVLALWGIGCVVLARSRPHLPYAGVALAILLIGMTAKLNMGIRHILPIYVPLSILAAHGAMEIRRKAKAGFSRTALVALLLWLFAGVAIAHPDYLAYFNEAAPENPAHIAVDSNLDWGQDARRLATLARELKIDTLHVALLAAIRFELYGVHAVPMEPYVKKSGWVAVSESRLALDREGYRWLSVHRPVHRVGKSIRLYFIP